jgi:hypothetical protein
MHSERAAGKLAGIFERLLGNLHPLEEVHGGLFRLFLRNLAHPDRRQRAVLQDGQMREQVEVLEHHADLAPHLVDLLEIVGEFLAVDDDLALLVLLQPVDAADHGRLARPRRAADDDALAAHHLEVDVLQHVELAVPFVHADDLDGDIGVGHLHLVGVDLDLFGTDSVFDGH